MVASSISKRPCLCRWRYRSGAPAPWRRWGLLLFPAATRIHLCKGVLTCHQQPSLPSSSFCLTWVTDALEATPGVTGESSRMPLDAGTVSPSYWLCSSSNFIESTWHMWVELIERWWLDVLSWDWQSKHYMVDIWFPGLPKPCLIMYSL